MKIVDDGLCTTEQTWRIARRTIEDVDKDYGETYTLGYAGVQQKAPEASGVYTIYSPARWIYVGVSDDIRESLFRHLNEPTPCLEGSGPLSFSFELSQEVERMARWHALVAELKPACNG